MSAYITTWPSTLRAARPMVWMRLVCERRKPSLSASRMATSDTSGRSSPSRSRLMPTSTSNSPSRSAAQDLDALDGVDVRVQVAHPQALLEQVVGQVLGHLLGQGGDQDPIALGDPLVDLLDQVVDLALGRLDDDLRVDQPGRADDLLDHLRADPQLVGAGGGRQEDALVDPLHDLLEAQRPVVPGAGQAEAVLDEPCFPEATSQSLASP